MASAIAAFTESRLKLAPFCMGGYSTGRLDQLRHLLLDEYERQNLNMNHQNIRTVPILALPGIDASRSGSKTTSVYQDIGISGWSSAPSQPPGWLNEAILEIIYPHRG